jgi:hypothetical protein
MSKETKPAVRASRIAQPTVPIDGINHAVRALYAFKRAATYKELSKPAGVSDVYMSRSLSASRQVGLTALSGKRGSYELTKIGDKYAMFITAGKETEAKNLLKKAIMENPWWSEIITFLKVNQGKQRDVVDLVLDVEAKSGKKWSNRMRGEVGNAISSILSYAELIDAKANKIIPKIGMGEEAEKTEQETGGEPESEIGAKTGAEPKIDKDAGEYAELRIPDSFVLHVQRNLQAIEFLEKQVKADSFVANWLKLVKEKMNA